MFHVQAVEIRRLKTDVEKQYNNQVVIYLLAGITKQKTINFRKCYFPELVRACCKCQSWCLHMSDNRSTHLTPRHAGSAGGGGGGGWRLMVILLPSSSSYITRQVLHYGVVDIYLIRNKNK